MGAARTAGHPADWDSCNLAPKGALHPGRLALSLGTGVVASASQQKVLHQQSQACRRLCGEGECDREPPLLTGA